MNDPVYAGTVGLLLQVVLVSGGSFHDPTGATVLELTLIWPDGTKQAKAAPDVSIGVTDDDDGSRPCLEYTTVEGELVRPGTYRVVPYVEDAAGDWPGEPVEFDVLRWPGRGGLVRE
jgi:hypothetical protein